MCLWQLSCNYCYGNTLVLLFMYQEIRRDNGRIELTKGLFIYVALHQEAAVMMWNKIVSGQLYSLNHLEALGFV